MSHGRDAGCAEDLSVVRVRGYLVTEGARATVDAGLEHMNAELKSYGLEGDLVSEDFDKVDADGGGSILLDEAVHFFLDRYVTTPLC